MKLSKNQAKFCSRYNLTEAQFIGTETINGDLNLIFLKSIPKGFNPTVTGSLNLGCLISIPEGFNPTVGGDLYLDCLISIPEGFSPIVAGYLYLNGLTSIPKGFNPTVGGDLSLSGLISIPEGFSPTVGDDLNLGGLISIPEGFNPNVGGSLYLGSLKTIPKRFNPNVGGSLYLGSLTYISKGFNPNVAGSILLRNGLGVPFSKLKEILYTPKNKILFWKEGKYVKADGIFTKVLGRKGNLYLVRKLNSPKESYLVTNGDIIHAHGDTIEQAKKDFRFKKMAEKIKKEPINPDTIISINRYRLITGACESGVSLWMLLNGITKDKIKVSDLLPLLEKSNAYGLDKFKSLITF